MPVFRGITPNMVAKLVEAHIGKRVPGRPDAIHIDNEIRQRSLQERRDASNALPPDNDVDEILTTKAIDKE